MFWTAMLVLLAGLALEHLGGVSGAAALVWVGVAGLVLGFALYLRVGTLRAEPVTITPPVTGRWVAINSPASRVPSHGLHAYGQTYAIDVVHDPEDRPRPKFAWLWPLTRRPQDFPAFGRPIRSPGDGVVVRVHDRERDHWSRNSLPAMFYVIVEGMFRELTGPNRILGNHVVVELAPGVYAALAHLRRGSVLVRPGQRVTAGQQLASCGNSGNSTEPHLHLQLMDHPRVAFAAGRPFSFDGYGTPDGPRAGVPRGNETFVVPDTSAA
ncbi:MAG: M23 family metallopeptidase [Actinocatenispora sp.]